MTVKQGRQESPLAYYQCLRQVNFDQTNEPGMEGDLILNLSLCKTSITLLATILVLQLAYAHSQAEDFRDLQSRSNPLLREQKPTAEHWCQNLFNGAGRSHREWTMGSPLAATLQVRFSSTIFPRVAKIISTASCCSGENQNQSRFAQSTIPRTLVRSGPSLTSGRTTLLMTTKNVTNMSLDSPCLRADKQGILIFKTTLTRKMAGILKERTTTPKVSLINLA